MSTQISSAAPWLNPIETINESDIRLAPLLHTAKAANASFAELLSLRHQLELRSAAKRGQVHLVRPRSHPPVTTPPTRAMQKSLWHLFVKIFLSAFYSANFLLIKYFTPSVAEGAFCFYSSKMLRK